MPVWENNNFVMKNNEDVPKPVLITLFLAEILTQEYGGDKRFPRFFHFLLTIYNGHYKMCALTGRGMDN